MQILSSKAVPDAAMRSMQKCVITSHASRITSPSPSERSELKMFGPSLRKSALAFVVHLGMKWLSSVVSRTTTNTVLGTTTLRKKISLQTATRYGRLFMALQR